MRGFRENFEKDIPAWKAFYDLSAPHEAEFPEPYRATRGIPKLILMR